MGKVDLARRLVWMLVVCDALVAVEFALGATEPQDVAALQSLMSQWENTPPSWGQSDDPCGSTAPWEGVKCNNSRVISLLLSSMNLKGTLHDDIGLLTELQNLDLSYNPDLGGPLTPNIGNLKKLFALTLSGCNFTGNIPEELGSLSNMKYLSLNTNGFSGEIPVSLCLLSKLYLFDVSENKLTGKLPVSSKTNPGMDQLFSVQHFHFNKNQLSGTIPSQIFNSDMRAIHVLFDGNRLTGSIPETIGLMTRLEVLRLDRNQLTGPIPPSIKNLTQVSELHLANNQLTGTIPNLTGMNYLKYLDLSNNSLSPADVPTWFTTLPLLTTLSLESCKLRGSLPRMLFTISQLQQVLLRNNALDGPFDISGTSISQQLRLVDLQNNNITFVFPDVPDGVTLLLYGNPVCMSNDLYCKLRQQSTPAYSTSLANCASTSCPDGQSMAPFSCKCAYPYQGLMVFRAPSFSDLTNSTRFQLLETSMRMTPKLSPIIGSVSLENLMFTSDNYLQMKLSIFPASSIYFNRTEVQILGSHLSANLYTAPAEFGSYLFRAFTYNFLDSHDKKSSFSVGFVAGIAIACSVLLIGLLGVTIYTILQKKRLERAIITADPFASWTRGSDGGSVPQLKGIRSFTFDEIKRYTNSFAQNNEIGIGGYGKVYKGELPDGQVVAIKRAQKGSMQGASEFKTEMEMLSRVHHKNLVRLVGFCYDQGEQMLIYEYMSNGSLRENLSGKRGPGLDWSTRLKIALGSARGLAYLHELADPPIIHRDIKSMNILLDDTLTAKVADFGLSKLVSDSMSGHVSTQVKGTYGYLDPEYYMTQQLTDKSDVYSFGVVMLELITSKLPIQKGKYVVKEINAAIDWHDEQHYGLGGIMDPFLVNMHLHSFPKFLDLALCCVHESPSSRPSMNEVVKEIEAMVAEQRNATSATSSSAEFGIPKSHPYDSSLGSRSLGSKDFDNSISYTFSAKIEPK